MRIFAAADVDELYQLEVDETVPEGRWAVLVCGAAGAQNRVVNDGAQSLTGLQLIPGLRAAMGAVLEIIVCHLPGA